MRTKSEEKYLLELNDRLRQIYEVARDHMKESGLGKYPPPVDHTIKSALALIIDMETDLKDPHAEFFSIEGYNTLYGEKVEINQDGEVIANGFIIDRLDREKNPNRYYAAMRGF